MIFSNNLLSFSCLTSIWVQWEGEQKSYTMIRGSTHYQWYELQNKSFVSFIGQTNTFIALWEAGVSWDDRDMDRVWTLAYILNRDTNKPNVTEDMCRTTHHNTIWGNRQTFEAMPAHNNYGLFHSFLSIFLTGMRDLRSDHKTYWLETNESRLYQSKSKIVENKF